jgi:hypothetical protein
MPKNKGKVRPQNIQPLLVGMCHPPATVAMDARPHYVEGPIIMSSRGSWFHLQIGKPTATSSINADFIFLKKIGR